MPQATTDNRSLLDATIRVPDTVVFRDFATETVVLNLETGKYHGLNRTAGEMLVALGEHGSVQMAADVLAKRHGVDLATVRDDLCALCQQLGDRALIVIDLGEPR